MEPVPAAPCQRTALFRHVTDEAGLAAANRPGGRSIGVRMTDGHIAHESLPDVAAARAWLQATINGQGDGARA